MEVYTQFLNEILEKNNNKKDTSLALDKLKTSIA